MNLKLVGFGGTKILGVFRPHQTFGPMEWVEARARELSPCGNSESHAPKVDSLESAIGRILYAFL